MSAPDRSFDGLPGADLVLRGLDDLARARSTPEAALCEVARTRLSELGLPVPEASPDGPDAALCVYERLGARYRDRDPYPVYCAWLDQLDSFVSALTLERERDASRS